MNQFRLLWQQTFIIIYVTVTIYMYLLTVCLFTKILIFRVLLIQAWNSLDRTIRNLPTFSSFKLKLQQIYFTKGRNPPHYSVGDRFLSVLHFRMQNKCSALNADWYHANLIINSNCLCWCINENAERYLLHCNRFTLSLLVTL